MRCDLNGQVAFVTGAAGAIGRVIAKRFAENGAAVVIADIDHDGAERVADSLPKAIACRVDIRSAASVETATAACMERFGRFDILVNNAGVNTFAHRVNIDAFPPEQHKQIRSQLVDDIGCRPDLLDIRAAA